MTTGSVDVDDTIGDLTQLLIAIAHQSLRDHRMPDVPSIVTSSLAAAAANVGGPECLLAGRSGSWEATCLRDLLLGAMGECADQWWKLITEAVTVSLNVAELVEDNDLHPGLIGLYEAEEKLDASFGAGSDYEQVTQAEDAALTDLQRRYADSYAVHAQRFVASVESVASDLNLPLPPQVLVDADPQSAWWDDRAIRNSVNADSALANDLWALAHVIVPLPKVDIRFDQPQPTKGG